MYESVKDAKGVFTSRHDINWTKFGVNLSVNESLTLYYQQQIDSSHKQQLTLCILHSFVSFESEKK